MNFLGNFVAPEGCDGGPNPMGKLFGAMARGPGLAPSSSSISQWTSGNQAPAGADLLMRHQWDMEFATFVGQPPTMEPLAHAPALSYSSSSPSAAHVTMHPSPNSTLPLFTPTPLGPMVFPRGPLTAPALPLSAPAGECQVFGADQRTFEEKKAQSKFFQFTDKVRSGEIRLQGKHIYERTEEGAWPEELQKEIEEQEAAGVQEQRSWFDHFEDMDELAEHGLEGEAFSEAEWSTAFQQAMQNLRQDNSDVAQQWFEEFRRQNQATYSLTKDNAYDYSAEPFEEGLKLLAAGNLSEAILCFEAAVKRDPDHVLAWQYLGTTQAENEQDPSAILAMQECLRRQPDNLVALLAMATSLTNENRTDEALQALQTWVQSNPKYAAVVPPAETEVVGGEDEYDLFVMQPHLHGRVLAMFRQAEAMMQAPDPDLHIALGVIHHMVHNFDDAVASFQRALQLQPQDARLWNKLGATLANSRRSEDAIVAYNRALDLNPGFVRAQYNLGIAYSNLALHRDAARAFLQALHLQRASAPAGGHPAAVTSQAIWDVLRTTFTFMNRHDLLEKSQAQDVSAFQDEFQFT